MYWEIELEDRMIEVCLDCDVKWDNDGIGSYEYWGFCGYDHGHDYTECENIDVKSKHSDEDMKIINDYIDENYEELAEAACLQYEDECRSRAEP